MLRTLWQFRFFILASVRGELKARFARSYLGGFWYILQPLAQAIIFAVVLSEVLGARLSQTGNKPTMRFLSCPGWQLGVSFLRS